MSKYSLQQLVHDVLPMMSIDGLEREERKENIYLVNITTAFLKQAGLNKGDTLVIDRDRVPLNGNFVIAEIGNEMVVRQYIADNGKQFLVVPGNHVAPLEVSAQFNCWGIVVLVMKRMI